jgi:hypothetical protein
MNFQMLTGMLGGVMPMLDKLPLADQSRPAQELVAMLTDVLKAHKTLTPLEGDECEMVVMLTERSGSLLMLPVTIDSNDTIVRVFESRCVDLTVAAQYVATAKLLAIALGNSPNARNQTLEVLRAAAAHGIVTPAPEAPALPEATDAPPVRTLRFINVDENEPTGAGPDVDDVLNQAADTDEQVS